LPAEEEVDIVNEHDRVTGSSTLGECLDGGLLHRAVAVLLIRSTGKLVLQQRSKRDLWHPGLWTLSSTGHVKKGETYDAAAVRELEEELGVKAKLGTVKKYLIPPIHSAGLTEHEWVTFYVARTDWPCRIDDAELEGVKEVNEPELRRMLDDGSMTPDAVIPLTEYLRRRQKSK